MIKRKCWEVAALVMVAAGCSPGQPADVPRSDSDSLVFVEVRQLDFGAFARAFDRLSREDHITTIVTEEVSELDEIVASSRYVVAVRDTLAHVLDSSTQGRISSSFATVAEAEVAEAASDLTFDRTLVSTEPAFAARKTREQFRYDMLADTVIAGESAQLINVTAVADDEKQPVRQVRLAVSSTDGLLRYVRVDRSDRSFFYHERTRLEIELRKSASGVFPSRRTVSVRVDLPFRPPRRFVSTRTYQLSEPTSDSALVR